MPVTCWRLGYGVEEVVVTDGAIVSEDLFAGTPGRDGQKNPVQLLPQLFWFRVHLKLSVQCLLVAAFMVPIR